jgi:hypothetical protein
VRPGIAISVEVEEPVTTFSVFEEPAGVEEPMTLFAAFDELDVLSNVPRG